MKWMVILSVLLASACIAGEADERLPSPTAMTQIVEFSEADFQMDAEGKYMIADRGDGCTYHEAFRAPATEQGGEVLPEKVVLWADGCIAGVAFVPTTGEVNAVMP